MDLEKLNKMQIVLLTLLVSFVTSIATGIVTVTLLDQAPPGVTNTITKIVEKTVETVVPAEGSQTATVIETIIIKEENLIADAVGKNIASVGSVHTRSIILNELNEQVIKPELKLSLGFVAGENLFVTDSQAVSETGEYAVSLGGQLMEARVLFQDENEGIALMELTLPGGVTLTPVTLGNSERLKLGQSITTLGGTDGDVVSIGIVASLKKEDVETETEEGTEMVEVLKSITTSITPPPSSGSLLFDTDGRVMGVNLIREGVSFAVPSNTLRSLINTLPKEEEETS